MDLFSQFPESNAQSHLIVYIKEEKKQNNNNDNNDPKNDLSNRYDDVKTVLRLRKSRTYIILLVILLAIIYYFPSFFNNLSLTIAKFLSKFTFPNLVSETVLTIIDRFVIYLYIPLFIFVYFKYPLTYSFAYLSSIITAKYMISIFSLIYGVDREKEDLEKYYTNDSEKPNTHLLLMVVTISGFKRLLLSMNSKKAGQNKKNYYFSPINAILIFILCFSEMYLGKYSFKMCLVGTIIGLIIYLSIFKYFCLQHIKGIKFIRIFSKNIFILACLSLTGCIASFCIFWNYSDFDLWENYKTLNEDLSENSKNNINDNFNKRSFLNSLILFMLLFSIVGINFIAKFFSIEQNKSYFILENIIEFNKNNDIIYYLKKNGFTILVFTIVIIILKMCEMGIIITLPYAFFILVFPAIYSFGGYFLFWKGIKNLLKNKVMQQEDNSNDIELEEIADEHEINSAESSQYFSKPEANRGSGDGVNSSYKSLNSSDSDVKNIDFNNINDYSK